jgi:H+/Cl- antiporter ClcA
MFDVNSVNPTYTTPDLLAVIFLGVIGGFLGSLYNYLVDKVLRTYSTINEYALEIPFILISLLMVIFVPALSFILHTHTYIYMCICIYLYTHTDAYNIYSSLS